MQRDLQREILENFVLGTSEKPEIMRQILQVDRIAQGTDYRYFWLARRLTPVQRQDCGTT